MIVNVTRRGKTEPRYEGPYTVKGVTKGGSYILTDETDTLLPRNVAPAHIKLISQDTAIPSDEYYEIQAIVNHKGSSGNYEYKVRWKGYSADRDTWEPASHFTDPELIHECWKRRDAGKTTSNHAPTRAKKRPANGDEQQSARKRLRRRRA